MIQTVFGQVAEKKYAMTANKLMGRKHQLAQVYMNVYRVKFAKAMIEVGKDLRTMSPEMALKMYTNG